MILPVLDTGPSATNMVGFCGLQHPEDMVALNTGLECMIALPRECTARGTIQGIFGEAVAIIRTDAIRQEIWIDTQDKREVSPVAMTPTVVTVGATLMTPKILKTRLLPVCDRRREPMAANEMAVAASHNDLVFHIVLSSNVPGGDTLHRRFLYITDNPGILPTYHKTRTLHDKARHSVSATLGS